MGVATRGGMQAIWRDDDAQKLIFHTDRGSTYTAKRFTRLCQKMGIRQSMGRVDRVSTTPQRRHSSLL
nr:DDE-type integrase/transposase/recombinase [Gordonia polyisoprenivorans]